MLNENFNPGIFLATLAGIGLLVLLGLWNTRIEADITKFLPQDTPVISDATRVLQNHPMQDKIVIDIGSREQHPEILVRCSSKIQKRIRKSELFRSSGFEKIQNQFPELIPYLIKNLPVLFTKRELRKNIPPLLEPEAIRAKLKQARRDLYSLQKLGQADYIKKDPLGFRHLVLSRMKSLAPSQNIRIYKGKLLSRDEKHLLLTANPAGSGTDTAFARKLEDFFNNLEHKIASDFKEEGYEIDITTLGTYRNALDNEQIIRNDVTNALIFTTAGIALLLLLAFPRPVMGLLAFLPAFAGTAISFFLLSIFLESVSLMVLGFGSALISITVDHGIAYLLFLDRGQKTYGKQASRELWSVGLITALTTTGAFSALCFTDFPLFVQLGWFSAMGIAFSFLFVHFVFPGIFPVVPPALKRSTPLRTLVSKIPGLRKKGFVACLTVFFVLSIWSKPVFQVDLSSMNTVSKSTQKARKLIQNVWGKNFLQNVQLMSSGKNVRELQETWDQLRLKLESAQRRDKIGSAFVPSVLFPGAELRKNNFQAWKGFWNQERVSKLKSGLRDAAREYGFSKGAFQSFLDLIVSNYQPRENIAQVKRFAELIKLKHSKTGSGLLQFSNIVPGKNYQAQEFYHRFESQNTKIFDPGLFSKQLGEHLKSAFIDLLIIVGTSVFLLLCLFFLDWRMVLLSLLPVLFSLVCTLGSLNLLGRPLDIPGLMLSIVVLGMGIDYSLFTVRAYQRYKSTQNINFTLIQTAVFMAGISSMIGFGVLAFSRHTVLESVGIISILGIGFALAGAFLLLPTSLESFVFKKTGKESGLHWKKRVLRRYRDLEAYTKMFARFKLKLDPMFPELKGFLNSSPPERILDIGCGYAIPACCILEWFPGTEVTGVEPDPERARVASLVIGGSGEVILDSAPELPKQCESFDTVLMLDCVHFLSEPELVTTLEKCHRSSTEKGKFILRANVPPSGKASLLWRLKSWKLKISKVQVYHRATPELEHILEQVGFEVNYTEFSGSNPESVWIVATKKSEQS